jgi:hypothetical protein
MNKLSLLTTICLVCALMSTSGSAQTYNYNVATAFEEGWETDSNPNGVWSYGYSASFTSSITLYDEAGLCCEDEQYWYSSLVDEGNSPVALYNDGPAYNDGNVDYLAHEFVLVAGVGGQYSDVVFTAPADAAYSIAGQFRGAQYGVGTVVGIVENPGGKILFSSSVTSVGQLVSFKTEINLKAGNTLVFSVGPGGGLQNTGLAAVITKMKQENTSLSYEVLDTAKP